jgi:hypothetical protein
VDILDVGPDGSDNAGALMPKYCAFGVEISTEDRMNIGTANTASLNGHHSLSIPAFRGRLLLDPYELFTGKNRCFHCDILSVLTWMILPGQLVTGRSRGKLSRPSLRKMERRI